MTDNICSGSAADEHTSGEYITASIPKTDKVCPMCEDYSKKHASKPVAVMCCEGACLRGEIARQAANLICHKLAPEKTVRVCLGGAFTKDTGQRTLVKDAPRLIAVEGCFIDCASRTMVGVISDLQPEIVHADELCEFDTSLFGIDEMPESQIRTCAEQVAKAIVETL
ncbi:MAG: putative zinc-binding protein [Planctomycetota bacterium]